MANFPVLGSNSRNMRFKGKKPTAPKVAPNAVLFLGGPAEFCQQSLPRGDSEQQVRSDAQAKPKSQEKLPAWAGVIACGTELSQHDQQQHGPVSDPGKHQHSCQGASQRAQR